MLAEGYSTKRVYGSGPIPCDVMIVGEAPGANEDSSGIPFSGKAGNILNKALKDAGLPRNDVFVTNCVPFRPPKNRKPTQVEFLEVLNFLRDDLWTVKPKHVVLLGSTALGLLTTKQGITSNRGWVAQKNHCLGSIRVFATYHPAAALYDRSKLSEFAEDLKKFSKDILSSPVPLNRTRPN